MEEKKCPKCMNFGWWPIEGLFPIGEKDSKEWEGKTIKCPWCGAGSCGYGARYRILKERKKDEETIPKEPVKKWDRDSMGRFK